MKRLNWRRFSHPWIGRSRLSLAASALLLLLAGADEPQPTPAITLERPDFPVTSGTIVGSRETGFGFRITGSNETIPLTAGSKLTFPAREISTPLPRSPFQLLGGECMRISGLLNELSATTLSFAVPGSEKIIRVPRAAAQGVVQNPGESRIFFDDFETLARGRWSVEGSPTSDESQHLGGQKSLRISPGGNAITNKLEEPLSSGRIDLAFHDSGKILAGNRCSVELSFRGPQGTKALRIDLGWQEESLTVESPGGPALAVQRLSRVPGWHRLSARFNAETTEISVDGKLLANGKGPSGPLTSIRLGSSGSASDTAKSTNSEAACYFDDLQLIRYSDPATSIEIDPSQDEARLSVGDQLFGTIVRADAERIAMTVDTRTVLIPWSEVSGLYFRRVAATGDLVEGTLARVEWLPGNGTETRELDYAEGALDEVSANSISLATPYAGKLRVPRERVRSILIQGRGHRVVIDATSHHLGDSISVDPPLLDPPLPEGSSLERSFDLATLPDGTAFLALDVLQVVGEDVGLPFSEFIRKGELKTYVVMGGKRIDYLNRHIKTRNDTVERIRIPIPPGSLVKGRNVIRIEQTATGVDPAGFDDLGILQIALEIDADHTGTKDQKTPATTSPEKP